MDVATSGTAKIISKTEFKAKALEHFRTVEETGQDIIITDRGRPVLRVARYVPDAARELDALRDTVETYEDPFEPVAHDPEESVEESVP